MWLMFISLLLIISTFNLCAPSAIHLHVPPQICQPLEFQSNERDHKNQPAINQSTSISHFLTVQSHAHWTQLLKITDTRAHLPTRPQRRGPDAIKFVKLLLRATPRTELQQLRNLRRIISCLSVRMLLSSGRFLNHFRLLLYCVLTC